MSKIRRKFVNRSALARHETGHCGLCRDPVGDPHLHLADQRERRVLCTCAECHRLFTVGGSGEGRFRTLTPAEREALRNPPSS
jgi:hypothetical protein